MKTLTKTWIPKDSRQNFVNQTLEVVRNGFKAVVRFKQLNKNGKSTVISDTKMNQKIKGLIDFAKVNYREVK